GAAMLRIAVLRKSCGMAPGQPAASRALRQAWSATGYPPSPEAHSLARTQAGGEVRELTLGTTEHIPRRHRHRGSRPETKAPQLPRGPDGQRCVRGSLRMALPSYGDYRFG